MTRTARSTHAPSFAIAVSLLAFANFAIVTTEFVVVGLLPAMAGDLGLSLPTTGWLVTSFALAAALLGPPLTVLADRYAARHVFLAATLIFTVGNLLTVLVPDIGVLIAVRIVQGSVLPAFVSVASVTAARLTTPDRQGWAISLVNLGVAATTVLGIPIATVVADTAGWRVSFAGLAGLGLVSAGLIAVWFPRATTTQTPPAGNATTLLRHTGFLVHLLLSGVLFTAMFVAYTYIAAFLGTAAGFDGTTIGGLLMGFGIAGVFGNGLAGRLVDRDPLATSLAVAGALTVLLTSVALAAQRPTLLVVLVLLWGIAHMAAFVASQVRVAQAGKAAPAFAMSLNISVCNLGIALGATLGGHIVDAYGLDRIGYGGSVIAGVAFAIAAAMLATRLRGKHRRPDSRCHAHGATAQNSLRRDHTARPQ